VYPIQKVNMMASEKKMKKLTIRVKFIKKKKLWFNSIFSFVTV